MEIKDKINSLEKLVSEIRVLNEETLLIITYHKNVILGKNIELDKDKRRFRIKDKKYIALEREGERIDLKTGDTLYYTIHSGNSPYYYEHACSVPSLAYDQLKEKLEQVGWPEEKKHEHTEIFVDTLLKILGIMKKYSEKETEQMFRFIEQDQELPIELDALAEKNPESYLSTIKKLEKETEQVVKNAELKNVERAKEHIEFIKYAKKCGVETDAAKAKIRESLGELERKIKIKETRREIRRMQEKIF